MVGAAVVTDYERALQALVEPLMARHVVPGVSVALITPTQTVVRGFGITNVENPLPVDGDTLFQVASITKTFTATAILRHVEAGTLDLDRPIRTYLPDFRLQDPEASARVTLRHVLAHAGGFFGDHFLDTGPGDDALERYVASMADLPQLTPPGSMWTGNNAGFCLAGRVLEVASNSTYERAIAASILEPLEMRHSFFFTSDALTYRVAAGHFVVDGAPVVTRPTPNRGFRPIAILPRSCVPTGGLLSSARDMLRYAEFHLGRDVTPGSQPILRPETLRLMGSTIVTGMWGLGRGLAWELRDVQGVRILSHGGGGARSGQRALLSLAPERDTAVATFTNSPTGSLVHDAVTDWWQREVVGVESRPLSYEERADAALVEYVGAYGSLDTDVDVALEGGSLQLRERTRRRLISGYATEPPQPRPTRLAFCGQDRFVQLASDGAPAPLGSSESALGEFLRDEAGAITAICMDYGRVHRRR